MPNISQLTIAYHYHAFVVDLMAFIPQQQLFMNGLA